MCLDVLEQAKMSQLIIIMSNRFLLFCSYHLHDFKKKVKKKNIRNNKLWITDK